MNKAINTVNRLRATQTSQQAQHLFILKGRRGNPMFMVNRKIKTNKGLNWFLKYYMDIR